MIFSFFFVHNKILLDAIVCGHEPPSTDLIVTKLLAYLILLEDWSLPYFY